MHPKLELLRGGSKPCFKFGRLGSATRLKHRLRDLQLHMFIILVLRDCTPEQRGISLSDGTESSSPLDKDKKEI